jgi:hypothetical protein
MPQSFGNLAATTLSGGITNVATSLTVASASGFPSAAPFRIVLSDGTNYELLEVTAGAGTTTWTVTREVEDSSRFPKRAWNNGDRVTQVVTAGALASFFNATTGHTHDGTTGNGPRVPYLNVTGSAYVRVRHNANQSVATGTAVDLAFDTEFDDPLNWAFQSSANLTGSVAKTNGSATLTGTGTSFTTELSVGQIINVPGTATERRVVTAIASNTSLTVNRAFANTASGQTAARSNVGVAVQEAGFYNLSGAVAFSYDAAGHREMRFTITPSSDGVSYLSNTNRVHPVQTAATNTFAGVVSMAKLQQWDIVDLTVTQNSGATLDIVGGTGILTSPVLMISKLRGLT